MDGFLGLNNGKQGKQSKDLNNNSRAIVSFRQEANIHLPFNYNPLAKSVARNEMIHKHQTAEIFSHEVRNSGRMNLLLSW